MNQLQVFQNAEFGKVRTVVIDGEPWLVGKDVAETLGYTNTRKAIADHVDEEDKGVTKCDTLGGKQDLTVINESGLYSLVIGSKLPTAKKFKRWVTSEVLPTIRKTGAYVANPDSYMITDPVERAKKWIEEETVRQEQAKQLEAQKPMVLFASSVSTSKAEILVGELAKILKQNGVDMGEKRLFAWLREHGYLINRKGTDWNMPTQYSMERGLFRIKETTVNHSDGHTTVNKTPKVTGKGQIYFVNKFLGVDQ
jgi:anti-repressor protein